MTDGHDSRKTLRVSQDATARIRKRYPSDAVREAESLAARLRRSFATELAGALSMPATVHWRPGLPATCWLDPSGCLNHARLLTYLHPCSDDLQRPLILRVSINCYAFDWEEHVRRRMGWPQPEDFPVGAVLSLWHYELSLLPGQVLAFAPWVAALAQAQARGDESLLPAPPQPCHFWGGHCLHCTYSWTQAAWKAIEPLQRQWRRRRGRGEER